MEVTQPANMRYEKRTYASLREAEGNADALELIRVQGIATAHRVFMLSEQRAYDKLVYIITPESGPYDFIVKRFPHEERDLSVWDLPEDVAEFDRICREVQHYAVDMACKEVSDERL
jgi:hypothetical protein